MAEILIADDDEIIIDLIRFRLESEGHTVVAASDGEAVLAILGERTPDLIVLDKMMPIISGMEVLRIVKNTPGIQDIPVIMLTARKGEEDVVAALNAGANDYLTKPFMPQELLTRIAMQLQKREREASAVG
ncbi:response regulator transcription factor [Sphingorhabdus sp. M41]|uniref:response regulator transcription factor n=1 Tax=Sphingorhabdus sp. M41 TaxID=1806885 RepID=UPI00078BF68A|nr:response regulator [Sphingorhabdus sp. M41]AMO70973.1 histidine kinase [Sphingorhabdus sp. M41]